MEGWEAVQWPSSSVFQYMQMPRGEDVQQEAENSFFNEIFFTE